MSFPQHGSYSYSTTTVHIAVFKYSGLKFLTVLYRDCQQNSLASLCILKYPGKKEKRRNEGFKGNKICQSDKFWESKLAFLCLFYCTLVGVVAKIKSSLTLISKGKGVTVVGGSFSTPFALLYQIWRKILTKDTVHSRFTVPRTEAGVLSWD